MGYSPRGDKESDTTEQLHLHFLRSQSFGKKASLPMLLYIKLFIFKGMTLEGKMC